MKSSHTTLICIIMLSLFALHECTYIILFLLVSITFFLFFFPLLNLVLCVCSNQCVGEKMEVKEIGRSSKIILPACMHETCSGGFSLKNDCWCCLRLKTKQARCWKEKEFPNAKELCFANCPPLE